MLVVLLTEWCDTLQCSKLSVCSSYLSYFLILLNEVFYLLFMNFKSHKVECEGQRIFNVVLVCISLFCYYREFIYKLRH